VTDQYYMQRALDLAELGLGRVSPNPMVGCVLVCNNMIIGEGWHQEFGKPHAEVNAVNSVTNKPLLSESTFYITLEPCSFEGKTPACTDLLRQIKPKRVVVASLDPNPKVSGTGVEILREAGIMVEYGFLKDEAISLNKRFFVNMNYVRPYVILKWAETNDGYIAKKNFDSKWISNAKSRQVVHKWRTEEDAILVGYNTAKHDNPNLTARDWQGRNPRRVLIDPNLKIGPDNNILKGEEKVYVFNRQRTGKDANTTYVKLEEERPELNLLNYLYSEGIGSIIIEGGAATINGFIQAGLWDEVRKFTAPVDFNDGIKAPFLLLDGEIEQYFAEDRLSIIYNPKSKEIWQKN